METTSNETNQNYWVKYYKILLKPKTYNFNLEWISKYEQQWYWSTCNKRHETKTTKFFENQLLKILVEIQLWSYIARKIFW